MNRKTGRITAAELTAELNSNPEFLARQLEKERAGEKRRAELRGASEPLLEALREIGLNLASIWDLVNTASRYDQAIPILLEHLRRPYPDRVREGIARALAVPEARSGRTILIDEYRKAMHVAGEGVKVGLALAIAATTTPATIGELVELVRNRENGASRVMFLNTLRRSKKPEIRQLLAELKSDPDLAKEIKSWRSSKRG